MVMDAARFLFTEEMRKIGILPRREFLRDRAQKWIEEAKAGDFDRYPPFELDEILRERGTGRTTGMLLEALQVVRGGSPVLIMAYQGTYARELRARLLGWCETLGLGTDLVMRQEPRIVPRGMRMFYDHYKGD